MHARVRAVYHDTGRAAPPVRQMPSSVSANSTIANKLKVFQQAELHDEYYKLVDVVTELKSACQQEQERRVKAVARIRRLEEIVAMKDRKIESLLHAKTVGSDHSHLVGAVTQREMAQRDRQNNAMLQKLRHKIAQQSQVISSYEDAMQSLRSGIKSTNLMELEEERNQLYIEVRHHQEQLACQRIEIESQGRQVAELMQIDAGHRQQITKVLQENKRCALEKQKMDQEIAFFKARVEQLQEKLVLEQRKRTYDREMLSTATASSGSPLHTSVLASALEEMKMLMKKECATSIQHEKLKSPRSASKPSPRPATLATATSPTVSTPANTTTSAQPPPRHPRPQSAGSTRPHRPIASPPASVNAVGKPTDPEPVNCVTLSDSDLAATSSELATPPSEELQTLQSTIQRDPSLGDLGGHEQGATSAVRSITPVHSHNDEAVPKESAEVTLGSHRSKAETVATRLSSDLVDERDCNGFSGVERQVSPTAQNEPAAAAVVQGNEEAAEEIPLADCREVKAREEGVGESRTEGESGSVGPSDIGELSESGEEHQPSEAPPGSLSTSPSSTPDSLQSQTSSAEQDDRAESEEEALDTKAAAIALELQELGLLKTDSQDSVLHTAPGDSLYDSDFIENDNEGEDNEENEADSGALGLQ